MFDYNEPEFLECEEIPYDTDICVQLEDINMSIGMDNHKGVDVNLRAEEFMKCKTLTRQQFETLVWVSRYTDLKFIEVVDEFSDYNVSNEYTCSSLRCALGMPIVYKGKRIDHWGFGCSPCAVTPNITPEILSNFSVMNYSDTSMESYKVSGTGVNVLEGIRAKIDGVLCFIECVYFGGDRVIKIINMGGLIYVSDDINYDVGALRLLIKLLIHLIVSTGFSIWLLVISNLVLLNIHIIILVSIN